MAAPDDLVTALLVVLIVVAPLLLGIFLGFLISQHGIRTAVQRTLVETGVGRCGAITSRIRVEEP